MKMPAVLLAALLAVPAAAQQTAQVEPEPELEDLLAILQEETAVASKARMNADFVPGMVTVLHGADMEALGVETVWEALSMVPGLQAIRDRSADIHLEPYEKDFRVRFRLDGILYNIMNPPIKMRDALTSRIKIMAKLDIAEKRLPRTAASRSASGSTGGRASSTSASRACRRSSAKSSCSGCSTRRTCGST